MVLLLMMMLMPMIMQNVASLNAYARGGGVVVVAAIWLNDAHLRPLDMPIRHLLTY